MTNEEKFNIYVDYIKELIADVSYLKGLITGLDCEIKNLKDEIENLNYFRKYLLKKLNTSYL